MYAVNGEFEATLGDSLGIGNVFEVTYLGLHWTQEYDLNFLVFHHEVFGHIFIKKFEGGSENNPNLIINTYPEIGTLAEVVLLNTDIMDLKFALIVKF